MEVKTRSWYKEVSATVLCLWHINRNLFRGAEQEVSVCSGGIRHCNLSADLIMPVSICMQSRNQTLLVEAALSLMALCMHWKPPQPLPICYPAALRKRNGVCKLSTWTDASLDALKRCFNMQPLLESEAEAANFKANCKIVMTGQSLVQSAPIRLP